MIVCDVDVYGSFNPRSPWEERHAFFIPSCSHFRSFNPRSPWEERLPLPRHQVSVESFQSTLPVGGATRGVVWVETIFAMFQSTLPVGGATPPHRSVRPAHPSFNPRSPWEERPHGRQLG